MSDIVESLRGRKMGAVEWVSKAPDMCHEAADEIERLRDQAQAAEAHLSLYGEWIAGKDAEIERLRTDLRICWNWGDPADMALEDQVVWKRLNEDFGDA